MQDTIPTKVGLLYVSDDESALCILEDRKLHPQRIDFSNSIYPQVNVSAVPEAPQLVSESFSVTPITETSSVESYDDFVNKITVQETIKRTFTIVSDEKKLQKRIDYRNAKEVEKNYAPKILVDLYGFTDVQSRNGKPIDIEAWKNGVRYFIDVKYYKNFPPILKL